MGKSSSLSTGGGQTTYTFTATYDNPKFVEIMTTAAEAYGITYADLQAMTTQEQADWIEEKMVLATWRQIMQDKAHRDALASIPVFDFDSDNGS